MGARALAACLAFDSATLWANENAATIHVRVSVDAPPECADRSTFMWQLEGRSPRIRQAAAGAPATAVHVSLSPTPGRVRGTLAIQDPDGAERRRSLDGPDCATVVTGLAFVTAVILDPEVATEAPDTRASVAPGASTGPGGAPATAPSAAPPAPPTVPPQVPAASVPASPRAAAPRRLEAEAPPRQPTPADPFRFGVGLSGEVSSGEGPGAQVLPRAYVEMDLPGVLHRASVRLSAGRGFTRHAATTSGTAALTLTNVRIDPCVDVLARRPFRLDACAQVDAAFVSGQGEQTTGAQSATRTTESLGFVVRPGWAYARRWVFDLAAGAAIPLERYRFYFTSPDTTAYRVPPWSAFAEVSAGVRFW